MKGKKFIWVTFQRKGYHYYPDAPEDVKYLRDSHRHLFKFKVTFGVRHTNRDLEFHQVLNKLESWYDTGTLELNGKSCEMIADDLYARIVDEYSDGIPRELRIEVSEDGECGSESYYVI
jgi:hypothetical protein